MKCSSCGATIPDGSQKCAYCGESKPMVAAPVEEPGNVFQRIRESPQFQRANGAERLAAIAKPGAMIGMVIGVVFLAVFVTAAFGIASMAVGQGAPKVFAIVPVGMGIVGILMAVAVVGGGIKLAKAPLVARAGVVKTKRANTSSGSVHMGSSTSYFATFEFEDGSREEFSVASSLYAQLAEGDAGVVFVRANTAAAFDRVTGLTTA
jgi:Protein of unknown function (DUF2500)/zinc-ribbon domain